MRACRSCCGHDAVEGVEGTRNGVLLILSRCGARGRLRFVTIVQRGWLAGTPCGTVTCVPFAAWPAERRGSAARCAATGELIGPECRQEPRERVAGVPEGRQATRSRGDRKSTRLNSSHSQISYAVFCLKKKITVLIHLLRRADDRRLNHLQRIRIRHSIALKALQLLAVEHRQNHPAGPQQFRLTVNDLLRKHWLKVVQQVP